MRDPNVVVGKHYAVWHGPGDEDALEVEYRPRDTAWRVSLYEPIGRGILKTTAYVEASRNASIKRVAISGRTKIRLLGGEEEICNRVPPWTTICHQVR